MGAILVSEIKAIVAERISLQYEEFEYIIDPTKAVYSNNKKEPLNLIQTRIKNKCSKLKIFKTSKEISEMAVNCRKWGHVEIY